jgi:hypothetical protein
MTVVTAVTVVTVVTVVTALVLSCQKVSAKVHRPDLGSKRKRVGRSLAHERAVDSLDEPTGLGGIYFQTAIVMRHKISILVLNHQHLLIFGTGRNIFQRTSRLGIGDS